MRLAPRLIRLTTQAVVRSPAFWRLFRSPVVRMFNRLSPSWDQRRVPNHLAGFEAGLAALPIVPRNALDIGSGTGDSAFAIARRCSRRVRGLWLFERTWDSDLRLAAALAG